jgi:predicted peptidase
MTLKMTVIYRHLFAASVPICAVVGPFPAGGPTMVPDAELRSIRTPTWLVTSRDDDTVPPQNTIHAHNLIPGSLMTLYDNVVWNGHQFPGHWSWIYVARNDPSINGTHIWQWMAQQRR